MDGRLRLLLDTHVVLWALSRPECLSERVRKAIEAEENDVFVSVVSPWELAIKGPRQGLNPPDDFELEIDRQRLEILPVLLRHTQAIESMPYHHRDPFDRMLVAQAIVDGLTIVTADRMLTKYQVSLLPAISRRGSAGDTG
jgi:PIN domain nuclease of toxin-antitoxin system